MTNIRVHNSSCTRHVKVLGQTHDFLESLKHATYKGAMVSGKNMIVCSPSRAKAVEGEKSKGNVTKLPPIGLRL